MLLVYLQYVFGNKIGDVTHMSPEHAFEKALHGISDVQTQFTVLPLAPYDVLSTLSSNNSGSNDISNVDDISRGNSSIRTGVNKRLTSMDLLSHSHFLNYGGAQYNSIYTIYGILILIDFHWM